MTNATKAKRVSKGPKAANVSGALGHALAASIIGRAEQEGQREVQQRIARKDILSKLMGFRDNAEHIAFRTDLNSKLEDIKQQAQAASISLNAYTDANPIAASVRAECSLWHKMSEAVSAGFTGSKVDLDKPWPDITKAATAHLASRATSGTTGKPSTASGTQRKAGRKATPLLDKAKQWAKANLIDEKTSAPKDNRNLAEVVAVLCSSATVDELSEVIAKLVTLRDMKAKIADEAMAKAKKGTAEAPKVDGVTTTSQGATVTRKAAVKTEPVADKLIADAAKAQAQGEKRTRRGTVKA